jgi:(R,R)-butanediol dehydrogenase/meso-butanediol dehydrogenase/diacetyl reductase
MGSKKLIVKDVPEPMPKPDQVIVKVKYCGICGTDLHIYETGTFRFMGHEFTGDIESLGESVKGWSVGDRVTANPVTGCGSCYYCEKGDVNLCPKSVGIGTSGAPGAFAERVAVPAISLHRLDVTPYEEGNFIEPLTAPLRAANYSVEPDDTVLILGAGPQGLLSMLAARVKGAKTVYVSETSRVRAEVAKKLGADIVFNPTEVRVSQRVKELTNGLGPDIVFECAGVPSTIREAQSAVRNGGKIMQVGLCFVDVPTNYLLLSFHEVEIKGITNYTPKDFEESVKLIKSRRVDVRPIPIQKIGLSEIVEKGFEELLKPEKNIVRILVDPQR